MVAVHKLRSKANRTQSDADRLNEFGEAPCCWSPLTPTSPFFFAVALAAINVCVCAFEHFSPYWNISVISFLSFFLFMFHFHSKTGSLHITRARALLNTLMHICLSISHNVFACMYIYVSVCVCVCVCVHIYLHFNLCQSDYASFKINDIFKYRTRGGRSEADFKKAYTAFVNHFPAWYFIIACLFVVAFSFNIWFNSPCHRVMSTPLHFVPKLRCLYIQIVSGKKGWLVGWSSETLLIGLYINVYVRLHWLNVFLLYLVWKCTFSTRNVQLASIKPCVQFSLSLCVQCLPHWKCV